MPNPATQIPFLRVLLDLEDRLLHSYFAAQAMRHLSDAGTPVQVAKLAWQQADSMMAERPHHQKRGK